MTLDLTWCIFLSLLSISSDLLSSDYVERHLSGRGKTVVTTVSIWSSSSSSSWFSHSYNNSGLKAVLLVKVEKQNYWLTAIPSPLEKWFALLCQPTALICRAELVKLSFFVHSRDPHFSDLRPKYVCCSAENDQTYLRTSLNGEHTFGWVISDPEYKPVTKWLKEQQKLPVGQ